MTNEEAYIVLWTNKEISDETNWDEYLQARELSRRALLKQIPRSPIIKTMWGRYCSCGQEVADFKYCPECGQKMREHK